MITIRFTFAAVALLSCAAAFAQYPSDAAPRVVLKGHDPVAYFTESRPMKGSPEYAQDFDGARYYFASGKNRAIFNADPDRYSPQFAGNCAMGVAMGKKTESDPTLWKIVDGKLYVFSSPKALDAAQADPARLAKARNNWSALR